MTLFVLIFLSIYTGMHALVFWGIHPLLKGHPALPTLTWLWMALMIVAPVLVRLSDRAGWEALARGLAWIGYSWMGGIFLAFALFAVLGVWELLIFVTGKLLPQLPNLSLHGAISAALALLIVIAASFYGLYEADNLRVEQVRIASDRLPPGTPPIRIAQVSDMHLGLIHRDEALAPIISRLRQLKPDLVVATGDIVDAQLNHLEELVALWHQLQPPLGKFAVTGNHEYYAGLDQALDFLRRSGFVMLRNQSQAVGNWLEIAGVDDPAGRGQPDEAGALNPRTDRFTLLLKHRPRFDQASQGKFDLQLSGHAHRGQIFPFNLLTGLEYPMQDGLYTLAKDQRLYTSRGTGTWGPPMRVGSPPEITLIEVVPK